MSRYTGEISASQKLDSLNTSIVIPPVVIPPLGKTITSNSKKEQKNKEKKRKKMQEGTEVAMRKGGERVH